MSEAQFSCENCGATTALSYQLFSFKERAAEVLEVRRRWHAQELRERSGRPD